MQSYKFLFLVWEFIALMDTGKYDDITVDEVKNQASAGTIASYMVSKFGKDADFSLMEPQDWTDLAEEWERFENAIDEQRKMGIRNRGICLLQAYALQSYRDRRDAEAGER